MSSNIVYTSVSDYLQTCSSVKARITALENILNGMETAMEKATSTGHFEEYKLDTGQTRTDVRYRSLQELMNAYNILTLRLEREYVKLGARMNGRVFRLVDGRNFRARF